MKTAPKFNFKNSEIAKRQDSYTINPRDINVNHSENPRIDYGDKNGDISFQELKASIKENGIEYPVVVYIDQNDGTVHLAHGFRRMKAILELIEEGQPFERIKVITTEKNEEKILLQHLSLNSGKPLTDLELGDTLVKLSVIMGEDNISVVAKRSGYDYNKVVKLMKFAKGASTKLKSAVKDKKISLTNAISLANATDSINEQNKVLDEAEKEVGEEGKIKINNISVLKAKLEVLNSPYYTLRNFIEIVKKSKDTDLDREFTDRLEMLINDIEDRNLSDKQIIGKVFRKVTTEVTEG